MVDRREIFETRDYETPCHVGCEHFMNQRSCKKGHPLIHRWSENSRGMVLRLDGERCEAHTWVVGTQIKPTMSDGEIKAGWALWLAPAAMVGHFWRKVLGW